jgi:hypothetical protein
MDAGRAARRPRRRAAARAQSAPSLEADGVAIVASPPKPAPEVVVLSSSDDEEPEQHDAAAVGAPKKNVPDRPAERKRRRTTPAAAAAAPAAPRKRRRRAAIADTGASAATAEGEDSGGGGATTVAVKQETDGGWPSEFQPLRALPFERSEYERLRAAFFTEYDVYAGARESLTRGGRLRVTQRVTRRTIAIAEWPRLREAVEQLHADEQPKAALAHLRCLERYMQTVHHPSVPRILRQDAGDAGGGGPVEVIDLAASSDEEEEQPAMAIDVEQLEALLLGPALALVKQELIGSKSTLVGAASLPVVVLDRSHALMVLSEGGARVRVRRTKGMYVLFRTAASKAVMRAGRHYVQFTVMRGSNMFCGVIRPGWDVEGGHSAQAVGGHCFYSTYSWRVRGPTRYGDRIGMLLDLDQGSMTVYKNGERLGVMATGLSGEYSWAVSLAYPGSSARIEAAPIPDSDDYNVPGAARAIAPIEVKHEETTATEPTVFDRMSAKGMKLSERGARVTRTAKDSSWRTAASKAVMRAGRHYAQFTVMNGIAMFIGVIRPGWDVEGGEDAQHVNGHCFYYTYHGCHFPGYNGWEGMQGARDGDRIGLLLDLDQGSMTVYKNDERLGVMATGLSGEYCWAVVLSGRQGDSARIETAASAPASPTAEELARAVAYRALQQ